MPQVNFSKNHQCVANSFGFGDHVVRVDRNMRSHLITLGYHQRRRRFLHKQFCQYMLEDMAAANCINAPVNLRQLRRTLNRDLIRAIETRNNLDFGWHSLHLQVDGHRKRVDVPLCAYVHSSPERLEPPHPTHPPVWAWSCCLGVGLSFASQALLQVVQVLLTYQVLFSFHSQVIHSWKKNLQCCCITAFCVLRSGIGVVRIGRSGITRSILGSLLLLQYSFSQSRILLLLVGSHLFAVTVCVKEFPPFLAAFWRAD